MQFKYHVAWLESNFGQNFGFEKLGMPWTFKIN